jgi:hypothetical protein
VYTYHIFWQLLPISATISGKKLDITPGFCYTMHIVRRKVSDMMTVIYIAVMGFLATMVLVHGWNLILDLVEHGLPAVMFVTILLLWAFTGLGFWSSLMLVVATPFVLGGLLSMTQKG